MKTIKENWEAFAKPMKQSIENLSHIKGNISDAVADKMDEMKEGTSTEETSDNQPKKKKGCLRTMIKWVLILSVISAILSKCGNTPADDSESITVPQSTGISVETEPTTGTPTDDTMEATAPQSTVPVEQEVADSTTLNFLEKQIEYAAKYNIALYRFSEEEDRLADWIENSNENIVYLTTENIFGADQYKITEKYDGYLYYGQLKDGYPDGYGILYTKPERSDWLLTYENHGFACRYIGQFSNGRFDGFGVLFAESEDGGAFLSRLCPYDETTGENTEYFLTWANYAEYFGEFSEGHKSGVGNSFYLSDFYIGTFENALNQIDLDSPDYSVKVGEYKKDLLNGANKQYIGGYLYYDGESQNDMFDGYGVLYYLGTNIPSYEGDFKNDMRHGEGTSYSETGEVIYQGEWEYDDYA